ncbi:MAG: phosphodiesterase [Rubellimicrobium sp.]|nr:phosphodiesterase [Rubellimicrobium sp.]
MARVALPEVFVTVPLAHRGLHGPGVPENSLAAAQAAMDAGYGIECDLQPSADGVAMVFHDPDLARMTGATGRIAARTAAELGALRLAGTDESIPTFRALLDLVAGRVPLLVELKAQDLFTGENTGALEHMAARDLAGYAGPLAFMSFHPGAVAAIARQAPDIPRGLTTWSWAEDPEEPISRELAAHLRSIPDYDATGASFISHEAADLSRPRVAELKAAGARVLCWTITSPQDEARARLVAENITFEGYRP